MIKNILIAIKLLRRIIIHKFWVAYYCFQVGLYWQGITHDLSKFSWTEFSRSIRYWHDKISSLTNERNINGYSVAFLHHRGRNPHHYEYWIYSLDNGGKPIRMPKKYVLELICDYLAACRTYGGNIKTEFDWWISREQIIKMHPETKIFCRQVFFYIKYGKSLKSAIKLAKYDTN